MTPAPFQVHTACKDSLSTKCPLGLCKVSVIPPTALNSIDSDGGFPERPLPPCCCPCASTDWGEGGTQETWSAGWRAGETALLLDRMGIPSLSGGRLLRWGDFLVSWLCLW